MVQPIRRLESLFLDTAYAVALANPTDTHHARARKLAEEIRMADARMITTQAVLLEIGNSLSRLRFRVAGGRLLEALGADPGVEVVELTQELFSAGSQLFRDRPRQGMEPH